VIDDHKEINLMLVDDDKQFLDLSEAMLEREGSFNIKATKNQQKAIDEVKSDWQMLWFRIMICMVETA
jgi:DNA-binding NtrC family response regulator